MSCTNIKPADQNTADPQQGGLRDMANRFMADILVVSTEEITQTDRVVGNTDAGDMIIVHAGIKITRGKNISDSQTREIAATVAAFKKTIINLVEASYVVHETDIGTWGYDHATPHLTGGLQQAARHVSFKVGKLYKIG